MNSILSIGSKLPKYYANFNQTQQKSYWDYENHVIKCGHQDDYEIYTKIGQGRYSEVFRGYNIMNHKNVIIKVLKPNDLNKLKRETLILQNLNKHPNVVDFLDIVQDFSSQRYTLLFEELNTINLKQNYDKLTLSSIKFLIKNVFEALDYAHSRGIFHRDIKPQNLITDSAFSYCKLIDWGLAEFYHPNQEYNTRVASRYFKSPEILLDFRQYHHSIDSWGVGCLMAGMIFKREPFFKGEDNDDQLKKIIQVLGTDALNEYLAKWKINLPTRFKNIPYSRKKNFELFIDDKNEEFCTPEALDLLKKLLIFDHQDRILPKDALEHNFFQ